MVDIPYGYCHCGCGNKTTIAKKTDSKAGVKKGEPNLRLLHHGKREKRKIKEVGACIDCGDMILSGVVRKRCQVCADERKETIGKHRNRKSRHTDEYKAGYRDYILKKTYNISKSEYDKKLEEQGDRCGICRAHKSEFKKALFVDHCHRTNKFRGILCSKCNFLIGQANDNPLILGSAARYLKQFSKLTNDDYMKEKIYDMIKLGWNQEKEVA